MKRADKMSLPEDNGGLPHHLIVTVPKKKEIISRLEM